MAISLLRLLGALSGALSAIRATMKSYGRMPPLRRKGVGLAILLVSIRHVDFTGAPISRTATLFGGLWEGNSSIWRPHGIARELYAACNSPRYRTFLGRIAIISTLLASPSRPSDVGKWGESGDLKKNIRSFLLMPTGLWLPWLAIMAVGMVFYL